MGPRDRASYTRNTTFPSAEQVLRFLSFLACHLCCLTYPEWLCSEPETKTNRRWVKAAFYYFNIQSLYAVSLGKKRKIISTWKWVWMFNRLYNSDKVAQMTVSVGLWSYSRSSNKVLEKTALAVVMGNFCPFDGKQTHVQVQTMSGKRGNNHHGIQLLSIHLNSMPAEMFFF